MPTSSRRTTVPATKLSVGGGVPDAPATVLFLTRRGGRLCPPADSILSLLQKQCHCEGAPRPWQSASPVPSAPLPKGGWHGEAVTGGFLSRTAPLVTGAGRRGRRPLRSSIGNPSVGATLAVARPLHLLLRFRRGRCLHRPATKTYLLSVGATLAVARGRGNRRSAASGG